MTKTETDRQSLPQELAELRRLNSRLESRVAELASTVEFFRASEQRYKHMVDHMGEGLGVVDLKERFVFCNASAERLFGARAGNLVGRNIREFVSAEHFAKIRKETDIRRKGVKSAYEMEITAQDGAKKVLSIIAVPWLDSSNKVSGAFATFRDITPQRAAEEALQRERDRAQMYLDTARVILVAVGADHRVTMINRKGCEIIGASELEIVGRNWFESFIPDRLRRRVAQVFDRLMSGEIAPTEYFENPIVTARGEERLVAWHNTLLTDEHGSAIGTLSSGEDITGRKLTEEKLLRLERMRAMAEMTARISHNLNNILVGVTAHCQFLERASHDPQVLKEAAAIMKSAGRAENLVRRLQWAVLGRDEEVEPVSLNEHVLEAVREIRHYLNTDPANGRHPIEVLTALDELPLVRATNSGIHDILVNVLLNAVDAMPNGGTIRILTRRAEDGVHLTVRDNGQGMDDETRRRVFEPFFTTKASVGTGLGLSTTYGAVTRWGGGIDIESEPGNGTALIFHFRSWKAHQAVTTSGKAPLYPKKTEAIS